MQITPNSDTAETPQTDEVVETNPYPLEEGQDQIVFVLDLRREDPDSPKSPAGDLGFILAGESPETAQALSFLVDSIAELLGFDPALSRLGISKAVDFESSSSSVTLDQLRDNVAGLAPSSESEEIQTEQPIEMTGGGDVVDAEDPSPETTESEEIPEVIEDVPHEQEPETTDAPALPDEALEGNPVGDSIASEPGPVDPPVEG